MNEAAATLNVDRKTLRRWLKMANIAPKSSPADGRAVALTEKQVERLRLIHAPHMPHTLIKQIPVVTPQALHNFPPIKQERTSYSQKTTGTAPESELPAGYIGWREWARIHNIPETTIQKSREKGRLPAIEGRWKHGSVYITHALDATCQQAAYNLWHNSERFHECNHCPNQHN